MWETSPCGTPNASILLFQVNTIHWHSTAIPLRAECNSPCPGRIRILSLPDPQERWVRNKRAPAPLKLPCCRKSSETPLGSCLFFPSWSAYDPRSLLSNALCALGPVYAPCWGRALRTDCKGDRWNTSPGIFSLSVDESVFVPSKAHTRARNMAQSEKHLSLKLEDIPSSLRGRLAQWHTLWEGERGRALGIPGQPAQPTW